MPGSGFRVTRYHSPDETPSIPSPRLSSHRVPSPRPGNLRLGPAFLSSFSNLPQLLRGFFLSSQTRGTVLEAFGSLNRRGEQLGGEGPGRAPTAPLPPPPHSRRGRSGDARQFTALSCSTAHWSVAAVSYPPTLSRSFPSATPPEAAASPHLPSAPTSGAAPAPAPGLGQPRRRREAAAVRMRLRRKGGGEARVRPAPFSTRCAHAPWGRRGVTHARRAAGGQRAEQPPRRAAPRRA